MPRTFWLRSFAISEHFWSSHIWDIGPDSVAGRIEQNRYFQRFFGAPQVDSAGLAPPGLAPVSFTILPGGGYRFDFLGNPGSPLPPLLVPLDSDTAPVTDNVPAGTVVPEPEPAPAPGGGRIATLLVAADPAVAAGLIPIEYGPANKEDPLGEGWLATYLAQNQAPMRIDWDADMLGSAATDLGILLGPVLGMIEFSGDFSGGFTLAPLSTELDQLTLAPGSDYDLGIDANCVVAGHALLVDAHALGAGDHVAFDGSAVTGGSFTFLGGDGNDIFYGGAGSDWISGAGGADMLSGGGGHDTFAYTGAGESTGTTFDTLIDFNPAEDHIDLPGGVTGMGAAIETGSLSLASFDADLAAALGGLGASQAALFAPDAGDFAGNIFLVVDANGVAGYQPGEDYVFAITGATLTDLTGHGTGIFV